MAKASKRALLLSALAIVLCIAMLIGTTYAWFTDTASTAVNKIQSGKLKISLIDADGNSLEGKSLRWTRKAASGRGTEIIDENGLPLWEPGATYRTEWFYIRNDGDLALKYKVSVNGFSGDTKLLDVLEFSFMLSGDNIPGGMMTINSLDEFNNYTGHLLPASEGISTDTVTTDPEIVGIRITAKMKKEAGNEYQGLSLDGIGITVVATQYTYEKDSINDQYDKDAEYPEFISGSRITDIFPDLKDKDGNAIDFGVNAPAKDISIDGQGVVTVNDFADYWFAGDVTVKGVTFRNGACFTAKEAGTTGTITFENCTFYGCDQSKIDLTAYQYNSLKNSGDGMCLNIDTKSSPDLKVVIKNCIFVGENDTTLNRNGWKDIGGQNWNPDTAVKNKSRGHAVVINGISGGGDNARAESVLIEGCTMSGIRGHAIQLYALRMGVTVKDCKINSWGRNAQTTAGTANDAAIRGDIVNGSNGSLTLQNNYFGLDESESIHHINVNNFSGNTNGTRTAGIY